MEAEWVIKLMEDISRRAKLEKPSWQTVREYRDKL